MLLTDHLHVVQGLAPDADRFNGDPAGDVVSLREYNAFMAVLEVGAGGTGTATIKVEECDDFVPSNSTAIPFKYQKKSSSDDSFGDVQDATAAGVATTAGADDVYLIMVNAADLSEGYPNLRVTLTEVVNDPVDASLLYLLGEPAHADPNHKAATA